MRRVDEPYRHEVVGRKGSVFYRAHSYHTKVPPEGIIPLIQHYTDPGDMVLDPFCGSGMTGVATILSGRVGILSDLSPAAVEIACGHTMPISPDDYRRAAQSLMARLSKLETKLYGTSCGRCGSSARIEYTVWSDTLVCPSCGADILYWDAARQSDGTLAKTLRCPVCGTSFRKTDAELRQPHPVLVSVSCGCCRVREERPLTQAELTEALLTRRDHITDWYPTTPFEGWREMWRGQHRSLGVTTAADFFTDRNLQALAAAWAVAGQSDEAAAMRFTVSAIINRASRRYQWNPKRPTNVLSGTLYIASLTYEFNVFALLRRKVRAVQQLTEALQSGTGACDVRKASATELSYLADSSVDYVFTDPPFGANIYYSDASYLWEAWLDDFTATRQEAVVSTSLRPEHGGKSLADYEALMAKSFQEITRVLKPGAWASVMFHNSDDAVWSSLVRAVESADLHLESAIAFDKSQPTFKGIKQITGQERVSSFDVVLQLRTGGRPAKASRPVPGCDLDEQVVQAIDELLATAPTRRRTTPYIHSFVMRFLLEKGWPLAGHSYKAVEDMLHAHFDFVDGVWTQHQAPTELA